MKRQLAAIAVVAIASAAMAGIAQAHYVYTFSGWAYHSVQCDMQVKQVPNTKFEIYVRVECDVTATMVDVLCKNPSQPEGRTVSGVAGYRTLNYYKTYNPLAPDVYDKKKGRALLGVEVETDDLVDDAACLNNGGNGLWTIADMPDGSGQKAILIREMQTAIRVYDCGTDSTCVGSEGPNTGGTLASTVAATCSLPSQYDFYNLPPLYDENNPTYVYQCPNVQTTHNY